jgi:putative spermidine/putrescine transport system permease protein
MSQRDSLATAQGRERRRDVSRTWWIIDGLVWLFRSLGLNRLGRASAYVMLLPALLVVGVLAASIVYLIWISFHKFDPFLYVQGGFSIRNFVDSLSSVYYRGVFLRTIKVTCVMTIIAVSIGLAFAYTMVRSTSRWSRAGLLVVVFLPFLVGDVVRSYAWLVMIGGNGAIPWLTHYLGFGQGGLLGTPYGVSLGLLQLLIPLSALTLLPAIHSIDPELEQAAAVMGARSWQRWRYVVIPLARNGLVASAAVSFTLSMTAYATPALLGNGEYDFIGNTIQNVYFRQNNPYLGSALAVLVVLIVTIGVILIFLVGRPRSTATS